MSHRDDKPANLLCDLDGMITNALRAIMWDPDAVAVHASWPISELDLHARHEAIHAARADLEERLREPEYYDAKLARWWLWGASCWIGPGFGVRGRGWKQSVRATRRDWGDFADNARKVRDSAPLQRRHFEKAWHKGGEVVDSGAQS